jgi:multidrug efflux pump subunit AcrB
VIAASLIECFLVLPGHLKHSFESIQKKSGSFKKSRFNQRFEHFREHTFRPVVRLAMQNRRVVIAAAVTLFAITLSLWISGWLKTNLSLSINFEQLSADIQFIGGATERQKLNYLRDVELALNTTDQDGGGNNLVTYLTVNNQATIDNEQKNGSQYASISVELISPEQRQLTAEDFSRLWRENIPVSAAVDSLQVKKTASNWSDFTLLLKGGDITTLKLASEELMNELKKVEGIKNLHDDLPYGKEQWIFSLTTEGSALGLTISDVGRQLRAAFDGQRVQIFQEDETELEVRLILPESERTNLATLGQFPIRTPAGEMLPLASVATWSGKRGIDIIRHHDVQKTITVSGDVDIAIITGREVVTHAIDNIFPHLLKKYDLTYGLDRLSAAERESESEFLLSFIYALGLIYIVLVWVFSSYTWPLAVMAAIPMGLTGALGGHLVMGMHVGPMSLLGMFALTGIVVNDSIILITTYKKLIEEGIPPQQAIEDAVCSRLRAVILTSLTTIAGLFPLMLEQAPIAQIFTPLAAAICFGLAYGTTLVLIVIPATLSAMVTLSQKPIFARRRQDPAELYPGSSGSLAEESH